MIAFSLFNIGHPNIAFYDDGVFTTKKFVIVTEVHGAFQAITENVIAPTS